MAPGSYRYACEPAATVIRALGGVRALATALKLTPEAVSQWNRPAIHGGTSGFVPEKHWKRIVILGERKKLPAEPMRTLLATGVRGREIMGGAASKRKGDRFEYQVVENLMREGLNAHRVPLSGAVKGYPGDVLVTDSPTGNWVLQCKITGRSNGGGRIAVAKFLSQVQLGRVLTKSGPFIALRQEAFVAMIRGERLTLANMPEMATDGKQINDMIEGHDALVFRRDGVKTWHALVREPKYWGR